jgi:hypothetical protein
MGGIEMPAKFNAVICSLFAGAFYRFFMFTKHDEAIASLIPFGEDPYDAIGSFCIIFSILLAILSLVRAFRRYGPGSPSPLARLFLARTQMAIPLGVVLALTADAIAMARHPAQWISKPATGRLLLVEAAMAFLSFGLLVLVRRSMLIASSEPRHPDRRSLIVGGTAAAILAVFPENLIPSVPLHFLAIVLGFVLIAATQAAVVVAMAPTIPGDHMNDQVDEKPSSRNWVQWAWITAFGILVGTAALVSEILEDPGVPTSRMLLVAIVFVGSGASFMLVSFAFFRKPLGLFRKSTV